MALTLPYKVLHVKCSRPYSSGFWPPFSLILAAGPRQPVAGATLHWPLNLGCSFMCRNIKTLFNFDPPVTPEEVRAASVQFVRKISGMHHPSKANEAGFNAAIEDIARVSSRLLHSLETTAPHRNREAEAAKARARAAERFGSAAD